MPKSNLIHFGLSRVCSSELWNFRSYVLSFQYTPGNESSIDGTFALWNFRSRELSFPGAKVTWNFSSQEFSFHGTFVPAVNVTWFHSPTQIMVI